MMFSGYERPNTLKDALDLAADTRQRNGEFLFCAGATDVIPSLKHAGRFASTCASTWERTVISLASIEELIGVGEAPKKLVIGSQTKLSELCANGLIGRHLPALGQAASKIASPQIRNQATVGGNLLVDTRCIYFNQSEQNRLSHGPCFKAGGEACHLVKNASREKLPLCRARFVSDLAPVMMLMGARLKLVSAEGSREVALRDFYLQDGIERNALRKGEILSYVEIDVPAQGTIHYEKLRIRNAIDFPSVGVAVLANGQRGGRDFEAVVTGVNTHPVRVAFNESDIDAGCEQATKAANVLKQDFFPPSYRRQMISVLIKRCITKLGERDARH